MNKGSALMLPVLFLKKRTKRHVQQPRTRQLREGIKGFSRDKRPLGGGSGGSAPERSAIFNQHP